MEENKNYTEPEQIEQAEQTVEVEENTSAKTQEMNEAKMQNTKPINKKLWIIIGAAVVVVAIVVAILVGTLGGEKDLPDVEEETTTSITEIEETTTAPQKDSTEEEVVPEDVDVDPKQEDIFYN